MAILAPSRATTFDVVDRLKHPSYRTSTSTNSVRSYLLTTLTVVTRYVTNENSYLAFRFTIYHDSSCRYHDLIRWLDGKFREASVPVLLVSDGVWDGTKERSIAAAFSNNGTILRADQSVASGGFYVVGERR